MYLKSIDNVTIQIQWVSNKRLLSLGNFPHYSNIANIFQHKMARNEKHFKATFNAKQLTYYHTFQTCFLLFSRNSAPVVLAELLGSWDMIKGASYTGVPKNIYYANTIVKVNTYWLVLWPILLFETTYTVHNIYDSHYWRKRHPINFGVNYCIATKKVSLWSYILLLASYTGSHWLRS